MKKQRIDDWLVSHEYFDSVDEAKRFIMAGKVFNEHERIHSAAEKITPETVKIRVKGLNKKYVSRGGYKLEKALAAFNLDIQHKVHVDIGSSTGGFTDCALQNGALQSYAIDVGTNQLAYELRIDPRVTVMEQTNFRYVTPEQFDPRPNFATIDVSFISLGLIFKTLKTILAEQAEVVALIKPQFEAERHEVGDKGIVTDPAVHYKVIQKVLALAQHDQFFPLALTTSPIKGAAGNTEYLVYLSNTPSDTEITSDMIADVIAG
ncbi:TlyA family RNA methyltransferase [Macrococcus equipercicus]|uniref:TlyA family RNA methyltransferase n=1 Tax=Macrococcus equipercicus TaxID=69967 RepID=A0A9Q9BS48_9STAP|nr:TlyA family RNA methyltransferase [Macrococcus equipercicus]KAA1040131.1 TlyA family RNA methyltransferase [Macrococcus equipercicus]UTH12921.1 TlyA family RNA methyltransferase [Macrococcus equipercicus]